MQTKRLTAMEQRAQRFGTQIRSGLVTVIILERSRSGGCTIRNNAWQSVARANGCNYDKESAVLADLLRWVGETEAEQQAIWGCEDVQQLTRVLASLGWVFHSLGGGKRSESYAIRRPYPGESIE